MNAKTIYLLPDRQTGDGYQALPGMVYVQNSKPIEIDGFATYVFLKRLDNDKYPLYCVARAQKGDSHAVFYQHTIEDEKKFSFSSLGLQTTETPSGIVVHIIETNYQFLQQREESILIKQDWVSEKPQFHLMGALYHLGIIDELSHVCSHLTENNVVFETNLAEYYEFNGSLEESLKKIYRRLVNALKLFNLHGDFVEAENSSFGSLFDALKQSSDFRSMTTLFPVRSANKSPLWALYKYLTTAQPLMNIKDLDDYKSMENALHEFQRSKKIDPGWCDVHTMSILFESLTNDLSEPLPIFKLAGIDLRIAEELDFPSIETISEKQDSPIVEDLRLQINKVLSTIPDPKAKIEWMNARIQESITTSDAKCGDLQKRVSRIESKASMILQYLNDVIEKSSDATTKIETNILPLHQRISECDAQIHGQFEIVREKLFSEQQNARMIILIVIILAFIAAIRVFM